VVILPSQVDKVIDLYSDYRGIGKQLIMSDSGLVINTFEVHNIITRNAFGLGSMYSGRYYEGEYISNASVGL
jgi:hypothetical protein